MGRVRRGMGVVRKGLRRVRRIQGELSAVRRLRGLRGLGAQGLDVGALGVWAWWVGPRASVRGPVRTENWLSLGICKARTKVDSR